MLTNQEIAREIAALNLESKFVESLKITDMCRENGLPYSSVNERLITNEIQRIREMQGAM